MPQRRFHFIASDNYRPRSNADVPAVSQLLKKLKTSSRDVRSIQKQLGTEIHLLERVYYKGKNQHGLSLFWRNVAATRRMASRIYEVNTPRLLEVLAGMFHEEEFGGTKVFSGAWTRIPPAENIARIIERLSDVVILLQSANAEFLKAYRAFCLFMPTTAFLQLTIMLVSIVARINALSSALLESLSTILPCVYAAFETLQPPTQLHRMISKLLRASSTTPPHVIQVDSLVPVQSTSALPTHTDGEDIGFAIARPPPPPLPPSVVPDSIIIDPESESEPEPIALETVIPRSPSPLLQPTTLVPASNFLEERTEDRSEAVPRDTRRIATKKAKKKKKARDEIDDIFG